MASQTTWVFNVNDLNIKALFWVGKRKRKKKKKIGFKKLDKDVAVFLRDFCIA